MKFEPVKVLPSALPAGDIASGKRVVFFDPLATRPPRADWGWTGVAAQRFWDSMPVEYEGGVCPIDGDGTRMVLPTRIDKIFNSIEVR